ncbi:hypothetical protein GCM10022214_80430 [Actinomadura miaoliensis]|uniref:Uncharacterized protein n=1 Tax=Actinomadura miaoliensis TaxID=430685 RepID=A0ABP7X2P0_9ACTN
MQVPQTGRSARELNAAATTAMIDGVIKSVCRWCAVEQRVIGADVQLAG